MKCKYDLEGGYRSYGRSSWNPNGTQKHSSKWWRVENNFWLDSGIIMTANIENINTVNTNLFYFNKGVIFHNWSFNLGYLNFINPHIPQLSEKICLVIWIVPFYTCVIFNIELFDNCDARVLTGTTKFLTIWFQTI